MGSSFRRLLRRSPPQERGRGRWGGTGWSGRGRRRRAWFRKRRAGRKERFGRSGPLSLPGTLWGALPRRREG